MRIHGRHIAIVFLLCCLVPLCSVMGESSVYLSVGHVAGTTERAYVMRMLDAVFSSLPDIDGGYLETGIRTLDKPLGEQDNLHLADIIFVYAGPTAMMDEISGLARAGRIQPIDGLPGFADALRLDDLYPALLTPALYEGRLWAVPVRVCPPGLLALGTLEFSADSWDDVLESLRREGFFYRGCRDLYLLWRTMGASHNEPFFQEGRYRPPTDLETALFRHLQEAHILNQSRNPGSLPLGIAEPDMFAMRPPGGTKMTLFAYPGGEEDSIYCCEPSWYLAVGSHVDGPRREAALRLLERLLGDEFQIRMSRLAQSPPVRPSIVASAAFQELAPGDSPLRIFSAMTPRLRFRPSGAAMAEAERVLESAFCAALEEPEEFGALMAAAVARANAILERR